jgi:hypothetical protein
MNQLAIAGAFVVGFGVGFLVRKNWYLFRAIFGAKTRPSGKKQDQKEKEKEKQSDSDNISVEDSILDKNVRLI